MKKNILILLMIFVLAASLAACTVNLSPESAVDGDEPAVAPLPRDIGGVDGLPYYADGSIKGEGMPSVAGKSRLDYYGEGGTLDSAEEAGNGTEPKAGTLTACVYDDHEYFAYWKGLLTSTQEGKGQFADFYENYAFDALRQIKVVVEDRPGAVVTLNDGNETLSSARTDNAGVAYLYAPRTMDGLKVTTSHAILADILEKPVEGDTITFTREDIGGENFDKFDRVELMFVIDTTGSMGDEISYLKEEIDYVIANVKEQTSAEVSLAIMVYRDTDDDYVTLYSDFSTDIAKQQDFLREQYAAGGGDFEEAVDAALTEAVNKQWSAKTTKIIIHVADAPAHDEDVATWNAAVATAAEKGIRIVSVASSGIDKKTEYFFRSQSLLTGGVYVYLTDDSGIGGSHLEATVQERPQVEYLNNALVRVIKALHEGDHNITVMPERQPDEVAPVDDEQGDAPAQPSPDEE